MPPDSSEDDGRYQFMDNYDKWDKSPITAGVNDMGSSHIFAVDNTSNSTNESIKLYFSLANVNHKYRIFEVDYYTV